MNSLKPRLLKAKTNCNELNQLINDYLPFIKKEIAKTPVFQMEYDDKLSIAMLVFMNCVKQYDDESHSFFAFASTCIRNRLIDEGKKLARYRSKVVPLYSDEDEHIESQAETITSKRIYEKEQERLALSEEIDSLTSALQELDIKLDSLSDICPKQKRSRNLCFKLAHEIAVNPSLKKQFLQYHRIPQSELAIRFQISKKTIEKHRRYILTTTIILLGDYPAIKTFLPKGGDL